jgi:protein-S-isoprenylcysteine O-methyltransferase Ste14
MINQTILAILLIIPLVFMTFPSIRYWSDFKREKKKGNFGKKAKYNKLFFSIFVIGVFCMWIVWLGGIVLLFLGEYFEIFGKFIFSSETFIQVIGLAVFYIGSIIYNWTILIAGKYLRPAPSNILKNQKLVKNGPFSIIRHPLYTSYFLILVGFSFIFLNLWILIPALFVIIGIYPTSKSEEKNLIETFGDDYKKYQKKVGMFFPKL